MISLAFFATADQLSGPADALRRRAGAARAVPHEQRGLLARGLRLPARLHHHERPLGADDRPPGDAPGLRAVRGVVEHRGGAARVRARRVEPGRFPLSAGHRRGGQLAGAVKVVAEWFPEKERALASGLFNSGSAVGRDSGAADCRVSRSCTSAGSRRSRSSGWRDCSGWRSGGRCIARPRRPAEARSRTSPVPVRVLLRTRFVWAFTFSKIFMDPVWYFYIFWFPEYLKHARGISTWRRSASYAWIPFMVAGFGNILGGWLSGLLLRRG